MKEKSFYIRMFLLLAVLLISANSFAQLYGIELNGTPIIGVENPEPLDKSFLELSVLDQPLSAGDVVKLFCVNEYGRSTWAVPLDEASVSGVDYVDEHSYIVRSSGCYSFYIKLKFQGDQLYIDKGNCNVTDIEDNKYPIVKIGEQYWMAENLKCSKYDTQSEAYKERRYTVPTSEDAVYTPYYTDASDWSRWNEDSKTKYGVNLTYVQIAKLGYLYNWAAAVGVADGQGQTTAFSGNRQGICPNGWHIPSMEEWRTMQTTIQDFYDKGIENNEGIHMKTILGWYDNGDNDNASKFSALPAGYALGSDVSNVGINTQYWSSFNQERNSSYTRSLEYYVPILFAINENKADALSVRCLRNTPAEPQCPVVYPTEGAITLVFRAPAEMECTPTIQFVGDASEHAWYVGYPTNPSAEALGDGWYRLIITKDYTTGKIVPIRMDGTSSWDYQGKYQQVEGREVEWLKIADYGDTHQLEFSEGKNGGVAYLNVFQWNSDPCEPPIPGGVGTFSVTFTGECLPSAAAGDKVFIVGNFEDTPWEIVHEMAQGTGNAWTYVDLSYPADFQYKFVVKYNNSDEVLWTPVDIIQFDKKTYDFELEGPCPSTHIREKCKASDYPQVTIGTQVWMAENYRCSKYDTQSEAYKEGRYTVPTSEDGVFPYYDADSTPYYADASDRSKWNTEYGDYSSNLTDAQVKKLGYLYNWAAAVGVADGQEQTTAFSGTRQGICPNGWHVPSRAEWQTLYDYIYSVQKLSSNEVGKYLKTISGWYNGGNGTDTYGFVALPAGYAYGSSVFYVGNDTSFWTATPFEGYGYAAYGRSLDYSGDALSGHDSDHAKTYGRSVRCLRDTTAETKRPIVNPTPGMATIVFSVPEVSCDYTTMNFVGDVQGYILDAEGLPVAEFVEAGWYKLVLPLTEGGSTRGKICPQSLTGKSRWDYQGTYSLPEGAPDWISIVNDYGTSNGLVLSEGCSGQVAYVDVTAWQTDFCNMPNPEGEASFTVSFEIPKTANPSEAIVYVEGQGEGQSWGELGELLYDDRSESFTGAFDVPAGCFYKYVISYKGGNRIYMKGENLPMPYALIADDFVNEWDNDPWVEPISGGVGTFSVTFTGECLPSAQLGDKVFIAGNFEDTPDWERVYELTQEEGTDKWVIVDLTYPAAFQFKFVVKYNESDEELWVPADNIQFDEMTYDFELEGPCPSTHIREKCKASDYPQVTIGTQVWMAENYRCSKYDTQSEAYREGRYTIPTSEDDYAYTPHYTDASDMSKWNSFNWEYGVRLTYAQVNKLGYLYNWAAAAGIADGQKQTSTFTGNRQGICPNGWHVPSRAEWQTLYDYIYSVQKLSSNEVGKHLNTTSGWYDDDSSYKPLDTYGFAALPAGYAYGSEVRYVGRSAYFWTTTPYESNSDGAYGRGLNYKYDHMDDNYYDKCYGRSVRCLRDTPAETLSVTPTIKDFSYSGGQFTIDITSNTSWSVSCDKSWVALSETQGSGNKAITANIAPNTTISNRNATITVTTAGGNTAFVTVNMEGVTPTPKDYSGVMLQGFYWDSYNENYAKKANGESYGRTKWADLKNQAQEIAQTFDMIWLPPSAQSEGGTGYHPIQWSNQTSEWGSVTQLKELIFTLKTSNPDMNVIADIVINHKGGNDWIDLRNENFGMYGSFTLRESGQTSKYICRDDEVSKQAGWTATGANDAGYDVQCEASGGYCVARDLDHSNEYLRSAIKAYLSWMKNEIGYDGWRYDYVKGYLGKYIKEYNQASAGAFSVGEYWDGSYDALTNWINETGKTSNAFDFNLKYNGFNNGLASGNYRALVGIGAGAGLIGDNTYKQYAVTFVDNHDTFRVNDSKFEGDWTQANAYIIAMPGTPCVFYPHWVKCKEDIKKMIAVRKACGITNTSSASCSSTGSYFRGEVTGSKGKLVVFIGSQGTCPSGFKLACSGNGWAYYTNIEVVMPITVKLKASSLSEDWEKVNLYHWGDTSPSWPGIKLENLGGWYSYTIQSKSSVGVIWNNTGSKIYKQTNDIENIATSTCYAMNEETDHVFEVDCQTGRPIVAPKKGYITLVFKKPESTKCNPILEWVGDNVEPVWTVGGDGNVMGKYIGDGWYSFELPYKEGEFSGQILYGNKTMRAPNWSAAYNLVYAEGTPTWAKLEERQFNFTGGEDNTVIYVTCGSWDGDYDPCGEIVKVNLTSTEGGYAYGPDFCGKGMDVTIYAYPVEGYEFVQWSDGNTENPRTIHVAENVNLSASFAKLKYTVTFQDEDGAELQKSDVEYGVVPKYNGAVPTKPSTAQYTYTFAGWDKDVVAVKTAVTYTATYNKVINEYNVILSTSVGGTANGSGKYKYGSNAVIEAVPSAGYEFVQWSDDNTENPRTLEVLKDVSYTAIFGVKTLTVELTADSEKGSVYGAGKYTYGKTATVYAKPAAGYMFASWSDGVTTNPRNIVVSNDVSLEALFVRASYNIEVTVNDMTMGVAFGSGIYDYGEEVSLEAMAFDDYEFVSWNDGNKENPRVFNATRDLSFVANFRDKELTTEAADLVNSECTAYANGNHIIAQSKSDCEIKIYDSVGRILTDCGTTDYCDCYAPVSGLYLVVFGEESVKVQIR
ncbi:MAG: starch-binding protein [Paludibacteraceae bacterium]|nr:starch-binding protein [Paludibacteraceae bacterium]